MDALPRTGASSRARHALATLLTLAAAVWLLVALGCDRLTGPDSPAEQGESRAYGLWAPGPADTCTKEDHDRYSVVGPDGLRYPTWHPPTDPRTGCSFGHEHGRDPSGSDLHDEVGPIPFGLANTALDAWDPGGARHEDHVGHKIEWENDLRMSLQGSVAHLVESTCDVLTKLHQGTHSKDAFTNNLHEVVYHVRCTDGTGMSLTVLTAIGQPGVFHTTCDRRAIQAGTATPATSPAGGGIRIIPDRACVEQWILVAEGERSSYDRALRENWEVNVAIKTAQGRHLASINPYYQVLGPSRYYDPALPGGVGRVVDLCFELLGARRAREGACEDVRRLAGDAGLAWDDPRSPFDGAARFVDVNGNAVRNADGPEVWYSDPFGRNASPDPFPGAVRQWIAKMSNENRVPHGPAIGRDRDYGGAGVHAPN